MDNNASEMPKGNILILTRNSEIFDSSSHISKLLHDIGSVVEAVCVIYIGKIKKEPQRRLPNTFIYSIQLSFFSTSNDISRLVESELSWQGVFLPRLILSLGDEIEFSQKISEKFNCPLYVFNNYFEVVDKEIVIDLPIIIKANPKRILVPNDYIKKTLEKNVNPNITEIKVINPSLDMNFLNSLIKKSSEIPHNNFHPIFNILVFPKNLNEKFLLLLKEISVQILNLTNKFQYTIVVNKKDVPRALKLRETSGMPFEIYEDDDKACELFLSSQLLLYVDDPGITPLQIASSLACGCPIVSTGDIYSNIMLSNSDFEKYSKVPKNGKDLGESIVELMKDAYLYSKYKVNCVSFLKKLSKLDDTSYLKDIKDGLEIK